jgi:predicted TIM-barrel fold metal-dependent hydrolase
MMTRRHWLALLPAGLVRRASAADVPFERIDTHVHLNRLSRPVVAGLQSSRWRVLSISDSRATGDQPADLPPQLRGNAEAHRESGGCVAWAGSFDPREWEQPDFAARTIASLKQQFRDGAIAIKVWKNIGMSVRDKSGAYLLPDHPVLTPIYEMLQSEGHTLLAHLAEPNGAWMPLDANNSERGFYGSHPEWHLYGKADAPAKETILQARDRVIARYPRLRVIGCHLGSNEEDLDALAKRLDRLPNFAVDLAARIRYFAAGDREKVRAFVLKYHDRILYGTDFTLPADADEQRAWNSVASQHDRDWQYFTGGDTMTYGRTQTQGLAIPQDIARKIFRDNAARWLPGIV